MDLNRRDFLIGLGGAGIVYTLQLGCAPQPAPEGRKRARPVWSADDPGVDYRQWLIVEPDGSVTAYSGRVEIGQGFTTVLYDVICQGMELPPARVRVIQGDTDLCPDDGPTTGSSATHFVAWGYWRACPWIRRDLVQRAAARLGVAAGTLEYRQGEVVDKRNGELRIGIGELADGAEVSAVIDTGPRVHLSRGYRDRANLNVNGEAMVTGTLRYAGDLYPEGCLYGGKLRPDYHSRLTRLLSADTSATAGIPGLVTVKAEKGTVFALGRSFTAVRKALAAVRGVWEEPQRPRQFDNEREIREGAELEAVLEHRGRVDAALASSTTRLDETYVTQYASQVPMETHTAVAEFDPDKTTVWTGTQNPFLMRFRIARKWKLPEEKIRVVGMPVGGGFGAKAGHHVANEAAHMARRAAAPVKYIYSRREQFEVSGRYKQSVIVDISSGLNGSGRLRARKIDIFQDRGFGTVGVYEIPNVLTRLYESPMPVEHGIMRGTSYVQVCFAVESHTDMLAAAVGMDPLEFRRLNVGRDSFRRLLDACGEMSSWNEPRSSADRGLGIALCHHGGRQLGAVAAEVAVDRASGEIRVEHLWGAFDIGTVININTLSMGVKGAMLWGLGYALFEEVQLDGHHAYSSSLSVYRIPRFSDTPPIELAFLDHEAPGSPRGCGEMPVIPTIGAISNAVHDAIGVRFHRLPMTPNRVLEALSTT